MAQNKNMIKIADLRVMTKDQKITLLLELRKEQVNLRFQRVVGQLEATARFRQIRRTIAQLKTLLNAGRSATANV
jgi:large subunit ribosomal protein L29